MTPKPKKIEKLEFNSQAQVSFEMAAWMWEMKTKLNELAEAVNYLLEREK